ncbi:MAG: hypothetical protein M1828_001585 [Chrysothrix sp. TS-e1954]|nr:MAG: hypothetical protein M1828_001585 [Chrysothrix sp. TS-e1954]
MDFNNHDPVYGAYDQQQQLRAFWLSNMWHMDPQHIQDDHQHDHLSHQHLQQHTHQQQQMPTTADQFQYHQQMEQQRVHAMTNREDMIRANWQYQSHDAPQHRTRSTMLPAAHLSHDPYSVAQFHDMQQQGMGSFGQMPGPNVDATMQVNTQPQESYMPFAATSISQSYEPLQCYQNDLHNGLIGYPIPQRYGNHQYGPHNMLSQSPTDNAFEAQSSSGSESDWSLIPHPGNSMSQQSFDSFAEMPRATAAVNPRETMHHIRTDSDSSLEHPGHAESVHSIGSFEEIQMSLHSPDSESTLDFSMKNEQANTSHEVPHPSPVASCSSPSSSATSPTSPISGSPPSRRRKEQLSKEPLSKQSKTTIKKPVQPAKKTAAGDKKVGRRRGPLRPEQRIQAGEIRKLRACLRCKFLKKTCDKGDPCAGCQPSHARLWQVPCTRIDIKDIGAFTSTWKADYERHMTLGNSITNIKGYATQEHLLFITHGYGYSLPIQTREIFVRDDDCFNMDWVESCHDTPREFEQPTARLTIGMEGISPKALSAYLDKHIDNGFENFISQHFEGTKFLTEMLCTAYRYYLTTRMPIIRKALKLVLAYNLTLHIIMVNGAYHDVDLTGKVEDEASKHFGKTLAPVMINFQVKHALAIMWRELQKDVLEELSALYSSCYSGDKFKNWPTIFMLATMLLAVWEEIQFDTHYRNPDPDTVKKFCNDMESTPVGVIVGLFSAISQRLPAFSEWDRHKHQNVVHSDVAVCDAMDEVRDHVLKYGKFPDRSSKGFLLIVLAEDYLKSRGDCKFDRNDFDCLSNKFLSKLVIRAN